MPKKTTKNSFWAIVKRLGIVLYFLITVPLVGLLIYNFSDNYLWEHSEYYFFNAKDRLNEFANILRTAVPSDKSELLALNDEDITKHFLSKNITYTGEFKKFMDGKKTSRSVAVDVLGGYSNISNMGLKEKAYYGPYIFYMILIDLAIILAYIILTDLLLKTGGYIINGKFAGGFNYKKLFNSVNKYNGKKES